MEIISLDSKSATTRRLVKEKPDIGNNPDSQVKNVLFLPANAERQGEGGLRTKGYFKSNRHDINQKNLSETDLNTNLSNLPLVTIVTVVFNGEKYLEQTIQSVINQSYDNIEYIIIDGGSTDGTLDIIRKYEEVIDYWVSEPDNGIYDAMNKGINLSSGDLIGLLNSGDVFTVCALEEVSKIYNEASQNNEYLIIGGVTSRFDEENNIQFIVEKNKEMLEARLNQKINFAPPLIHQSAFVSRPVYKKMGLFNIKFKICADYDFIYKAYHSSFVEFVFTDSQIVYYRLGGVSEKLCSLWNICIEHFLIRKEKLSIIRNTLNCFYWIVISTCKRFFRRFFNSRILNLYYNLRNRKVISSNSLL